MNEEESNGQVVVVVFYKFMPPSWTDVVSLSSLESLGWLLLLHTGGEQDYLACDGD